MSAIASLSRQCSRDISIQVLDESAQICQSFIADYSVTVFALGTLASAAYLGYKYCLQFASSTTCSEWKLRFSKRKLDDALSISKPAKIDQLDIPRTLLKKEKVDLQEVLSQTRLHLAVTQGQIEIVKELLEQGVNTETMDEKGSTPLLVAVELGQLDILELLLKNDAKVNVQKQPSKETPLHLAIKKGYIPIAKKLIEKGADIEARCHKKYTPLHTACEKECVESIKLLKEKGANINAQTWSGNTPLILYAERYRDKKHTSYSALKLLLSFDNINLNLKNILDHTVFYYVIMRDDVKILQELLQKSGALKIAQCQSLRANACKYSAMNCLKLLLKTKIDINTQNSRKQTLLHCAATLLDIELVNYLLEQGADPDIPDEKGLLPVHYVQNLIYPDFKRRAVSLARYEIYRLLFSKISEKTKYINTQVGNGGTILHKTAALGNIDDVQHLLDCGANPDMANETGGFFPIHGALSTKSNEVVDLLLSKISRKTLLKI